MSNKLPSIRFAGYTDSFKLHSLQYIFKSLVAGVSVNSLDTPAKSNRFGILKTNCISKGNFLPYENKEIIEKDISRAKLNPKKNTILISRMNTPLLVGEIGLVTEDYDYLFLPDRIWMADVVEDINPKWLTCLLTTEKYNFLIRSLGTGTSGTMKNISKSSFLKLEIVAPSITEQNKIADFFTLLDQRIEKQQEKVESWCEFKKGMMQKLFSRELRFMSEVGEEFPEWEETHLKNIVSTFSGGTPNSNQSSFYTGDIPFIRSGEISSYTTQLFINDEGLKNSSSKLVERGDLLYALYGATSGEVAISKISGAINQAVLCIRTKESKKFLLYYLTLMKESILSKYLQGGQGNLSAGIVKEIMIPLPSIEEQEKIADFLSALDRKNDLEEEKLYRLQEQKNGFMQKMFI